MAKLHGWGLVRVQESIVFVVSAFLCSVRMIIFYAFSSLGEAPVLILPEVVKAEPSDLLGQLDFT